MDDNAVTLRGQLSGIEPLRHTPAGLPLLGFTLTHKSQQMEAGYKRQVECDVAGVAMGEAATAMAKFKVGAEIRVNGFLNRKNRMSPKLILHVTETELLKEEHHA